MKIEKLVLIIKYDSDSLGLAAHIRNLVACIEKVGSVEIESHTDAPKEKEDKNICEKCLENLHEYREWRGWPGRKTPIDRRCHNCKYYGTDKKPV